MLSTRHCHVSVTLRMVPGGPFWGSSRSFWVDPRTVTRGQGEGKGGRIQNKVWAGEAWPLKITIPFPPGHRFSFLGGRRHGHVCSALRKCPPPSFIAVRNRQLLKQKVPDESAGEPAAKGRPARRLGRVRVSAAAHVGRHAWAPPSLPSAAPGTLPPGRAHCNLLRKTLIGPGSVMLRKSFPGCFCCFNATVMTTFQVAAWGSCVGGSGRTNWPKNEGAGAQRPPFSWGPTE